MASFAPGTPQHVMDEYYRNASPSLGGTRGLPRTADGSAVDWVQVENDRRNSQYRASQEEEKRLGRPLVADGGPMNLYRGDDGLVYELHPMLRGLPYWRDIATVYQGPGQSEAAPPVTGATPFGVAEADGYGRTSGPEPPPFQAIWGDPFGGTSDEPLFAQRDAFINNINEQMMPYYSGQATGAPRFDFQDAWDRGGEMVERGWQNPFAQTLGAVQQQSAPSVYRPPSRTVQQTSVQAAPQRTVQQQPAGPQQSESARPQSLTSYGRRQPPQNARPAARPAPGDAQPSQDPYEYSSYSPQYQGLPAWFDAPLGKPPAQRAAKQPQQGGLASRQLQSHASPQ